MMFRELVVTLVCVFVCVHGVSHKTDGEESRSNGTNVLDAKYDICPVYGYEDLSMSISKEFDEYGTATRRNSRLPDQSQIQCQSSKLCSILQAKVRSVTCYNKRVGWPKITWNCDADFHGSQYELANSTINCEAYTPGSTCVLENSCIFYYTPRQRFNMFFVLSGFGGFVVLGLIIFGICLCVRRRNALAASGTTTTIISTSPHASVSSQACTAPHGYPAAPHAYPPGPHPYPTAPQMYSNAPGYPGQQDYPPPYAAPYPQYAPQYGPPEPPKQAHY